ncbi:MAG: hypothetical protein IKA03_02975 [Alphaproteobacteria bacterium]|nr:hypothetical protein [Alphaproteobacteria bacterium]
MDQRKKQQILKLANQAYKGWTQGLCPQTTISEIDCTIEKICKYLAFGSIIVSGRNNPSAYIGTYKHCFELKKSFAGQIGAINNNWYWLGFADADNIRRIVHNRGKNFQVCVLKKDIIDTTLFLGEIASLDIKYGIKEQNFSVYIGNYMVCILLKRYFGGKLEKKYNHWCWKGYANFHQIDKICKDYQQSSRRYHRKKIVLKH